MKKFLLAGALPLAMAISVSGCQRPVQVYAEPAAAAAPQPVVLAATATTAVPSGTTVQASLNDRLSTADANVNDTFTLTLQTPIQNAQRQTVIPAGAHINGRVTAVRPSLDVGTPAILRLEFQNIHFNNRSVPFTADIVETEVRREGRTAEQAVRGAAAGAAAGAAIGAVIRGDVRGALTGAAVGAGAGTVISLGTATQQAVLEPGTVMTLRITEPVPFR